MYPTFFHPLGQEPQTSGVVTQASQSWMVITDRINTNNHFILDREQGSLSGSRLMKSITTFLVT